MRNESLSDLIQFLQIPLHSLDPSESAADSAIRALLDEARKYCSEMRLQHAQTSLLEAWKLASEKKQDSLAIEAALLLSVIQNSKHQAEWLDRASQLAQKTENASARQWLFQIHTLAGWHFFDQRKFAEALQNFQTALEILPQLKSSTSDFPIRWAMARTQRALGNLDAALEIQNALLKEMGADHRSIAHAYLEIAENLQGLHRDEEAKPYFESAHAMLLKDVWYADNKESELMRIQKFFKRI